MKCHSNIDSWTLTKSTIHCVCLKENIYAFVFQQFLYFTTIILLRKRTLPKLSVFNSKITEATTTNEDIIT